VKPLREILIVSLAVFSSSACAESQAAIVLSDELPIPVSEGLNICVSHFINNDFGETYAREKKWDVASEQEYPADLRRDKLLTKTFERRNYLVAPNVTKYGSLDKASCTIHVYANSEARSLPIDLFAAMSSISGIEGRVETFKACEQCLDDVAGHWLLGVGQDKILIQALSGARNDVTFNLERN